MVGQTTEPSEEAKKSLEGLPSKDEEAGPAHSWVPGWVWLILVGVMQPESAWHRGAGCKPLPYLDE